jgi:hypothetical protein
MIGDTWLSFFATAKGGQTKNLCNASNYKTPSLFVFFCEMLSLSCTLRVSFPTRAFESSRKSRRATRRRFQILCFSSQPNLNQGEEEEEEEEGG